MYFLSEQAELDRAEGIKEITEPPVYNSRTTALEPFVEHMRKIHPVGWRCLRTGQSPNLFEQEEDTDAKASVQIQPDTPASQPAPVVQA